MKEALKKGWVSLHWSVDGTLVKANASHFLRRQLDCVRQEALLMGWTLNLKRLVAMYALG